MKSAAFTILRLVLATLAGSYTAGFTYDAYVLATQSLQYFGSLTMFIGMTIPLGMMAFVYALYAVVPFAILFLLLKAPARLAVPGLIVAGTATSVSLYIAHFASHGSGVPEYLISALPGLFGATVFALVLYFDFFRSLLSRLARRGGSQVAHPEL